MNDCVLKSVELTSNSGVVKYKPYPNTELKDTFHWLAVGSLSLYATNPINNVCKIVCNSVETKRLSETYQIETFESPIQTFQIDVVEQQYFHISFNVLWHSIKTLREDLVFKIVTFEDRILEGVLVKMVLLLK